MLSLNYCQSNITKRLFLKNNRKCLILFVTSQKAQYTCYQWYIMEIQQLSSCATSDNDLFLSEVVGYSTDITVLITAFLIHMSVLAGQEAPILFSMKFSMDSLTNKNSLFTSGTFPVFESSRSKSCFCSTTANGTHWPKQPARITKTCIFSTEYSKLLNHAGLKYLYTFENIVDGYLVLIGWAGRKYGDRVISLSEPWPEPAEKLPL